MKSSIATFTKLHEWLADRLPFVQYPHIRPAQQRQRLPFFKNRMPWETRVALVFFGVITLGISGIVLGLLGLLIWSALFG